MNRRMLTMAAAAMLAAPSPAAAGERAGLSDADHQDHHLVRRRRRLRHHRPHRRAAHAGEARPDRRGREPARRRRPARQRGDRQLAEGRLHARRPDRRPDHRLGDDQADALRRASKAFDWIGQIATAGLLIVARPDDPYKDVKIAGRRRQGQSRQDRVRAARATARRSTSPPSCSSRWPASTCCSAVPHLARGARRAARQTTSTCCSTR